MYVCGLQNGDKVLRRLQQSSRGFRIVWIRLYVN